MAETRQRTEWERASAFVAMLFNINRDPKKQKAVDLDYFNPYSERRRKKLKGKNEKGSLAGAKEFFVGKGKRPWKKKP